MGHRDIRRRSRHKIGLVLGRLPSPPTLPFLSSGFCWLCVSLHRTLLGSARRGGLEGEARVALLDFCASGGGPRQSYTSPAASPWHLPPRETPATRLQSPPHLVLTADSCRAWLALRSSAQLLSFASTCEASSPRYIPSASNTQSGLCCPC